MRIIISQLFKFTFIKYIQKIFLKSHKINLNNLNNFWNNVKYNSNKTNISKVVLVECLEDINPRLDSYFKLVAMLSKIYDIQVIAMVSYTSYTGTVEFLSNYHKVDKIESVYRFFDIELKFKALTILFKNMPFQYTLNNGFTLFVNNINIGDLVYDEYLRVAKKETSRKTNLLFYIIAFNSIYAHLRYEQILNTHNVTDIISIRDTYSHASYCRASNNLENITIWKNRAGKLSSIRKLNAYKNYNHKAFYFEKKHLEYIKNKYSQKEINNMYDELIFQRSVGDVSTSDAAEIKLAHSHTNINTIEEFLTEYNIDLKKTTVIIFAHIFVDAVRYPHKVIFSDHYTWLIETLKYLNKNKNLNILVKPHPSEQLYSLGKSSKSVIEEFNKKYNSNLLIIDKKIASQVIYQIGEVLITGSGTIAMEAPCEGVKVITSGSSSYENTNAMFRSETQEEYFNLLSKIEKLPNISNKQVFNSKIGFIWLNKIQYVESKINFDIDKILPIEEQLNILDKMYSDATQEDTLPLFERLLDDRIN
jgi:hypothetical protein